MISYFIVPNIVASGSSTETQMGNVVYHVTIAYVYRRRYLRRLLAPTPSTSTPDCVLWNPPSIIRTISFNPRFDSHWDPFADGLDRDGCERSEAILLTRSQMHDCRRLLLGF